MSLTIDQFKTLNLPQMKDALRERKLHISGPKARLIERYETYLSDQARKTHISSQTGDAATFDGLKRLARDNRILLYQVHPDTSITAAAQTYLIQKVKFLLNLFHQSGETLVHFARSRTYTSREAQTICQLHFEPELSRGAVEMGTIIVARFTTTVNRKIDGKRARMLDKNKAGLHLRPSVLAKVFRQMVSENEEEYGVRVSKGFTLYLTAVIEYIMGKLLESAGNISRDDRRVRITPTHLDQALINDPALFQLFTIHVNPTFEPEVDRLLRLKLRATSV